MLIRALIRWFGVVLALLAAPAIADPIVIAHRGASGERPEHTLAAYERAIDQGADYIEPDLVPTKDGVLVARHENELSGTTDIASRPEFGARRTTKVIDGQTLTGWFAEDFTLAELRTLRARERLPELRPANAMFDDLYRIPTLGDIIALLNAKEAETGRAVGLYPEIKHPTWFAKQNIDVVDLLMTELDGVERPVTVQSFDLAPLCRLRQRTAIPLVFLASAEGGPADVGLTYRQLLAPDALPAVQRCADGLGVDLRLVLDEAGNSTGLIESAHEAGLTVHGWTVRAENAFLPAPLKSPDGPAAHGNVEALLVQLFDAGIDGVFADQTGIAVRARDDWAAARAR